MDEETANRWLKNVCNSKLYRANMVHTFFLLEYQVKEDYSEWAQSVKRRLRYRGWQILSIKNSQVTEGFTNFRGEYVVTESIPSVEVTLGKKAERKKATK